MPTRGSTAQATGSVLASAMPLEFLAQQRFVKHRDTPSRHSPQEFDGWLSSATPVFTEHWGSADPARSRSRRVALCPHFDEGVLAPLHRRTRPTGKQDNWQCTRGNA